MTDRPPSGSAASPGRCLELAGIPGSGKSRRVGTLAARLTHLGVAVTQPQARFAPSVPTARRLARKARACGAAAVAAPGTTARVLRALAGSHQPGPGDLAGRVVQWLVAQEAAARAARFDGVSILDEGPVQALWSIGIRGDVDPVLAAVPHRHPADLLVVVRVPPELALERLTRRVSRHSRTQLLDRPAQLAELHRGARLLDRLAEWWARSGEVHLLDGAADDGADLELLVARVCASVRPCTPRAGPAPGPHRR
ncbi:AAA family ATPase [Geodermatophilus ruber]|uniref:AAA domain-containing protein n=1 Tax=Geodermatophilus ruber TaxID=504800 RepID=A0A1I4G6R1_9ACTN|nr:AAA family ATPase [Geodermatophilus ruber]SFL25775.1 AAA domain-containing protein [Geodermatophilus ruber]